VDVVIEVYTDIEEWDSAESVGSYLYENLIPYTLRMEVIHSRNQHIAIYRAKITKEESVFLTLKYPNLRILPVNTM